MDGLSIAFLIAQQVHVNSLRNKRGTLIGVSTIFIVVFFIAVLQNILLKSPLIFLRLAESQSGEMDILMTASAISVDKLLDIGTRNDEDPKFLFLNGNEIQSKLATNPHILGTSSRWILRGSVVAKGSRGKNSTRIVTNVLICDLEREKELGIGRGWTYRPLGEGEAHVSR